jgi:hypothetical protein
MSDDLIKRLREAIARAWCHEKNAAKEMDPNLAEKVIKEISPIIEQLERENARLDAGWTDANARALAARLEVIKAVEALPKLHAVLDILLNNFPTKARPKWVADTERHIDEAVAVLAKLEGKE